MGCTISPMRFAVIPLRDQTTDIVDSKVVKNKVSNPQRAESEKEAWESRTCHHSTNGLSQFRS